MGRPAVVCRWARPFPGPEPEASPTGGARLGALLPQGLLLGLPHVKPGAPEEGARLLQAPSETSTSGAGLWVGPREQLASDFTLHPRPSSPRAAGSGESGLIAEGEEG